MKPNSANRTLGLWIKIGWINSSSRTIVKLHKKLSKGSTVLTILFKIYWYEKQIQYQLNNTKKVIRVADAKILLCSSQISRFFCFILTSQKFRVTFCRGHWERNVFFGPLVLIENISWIDMLYYSLHFYILVLNINNISNLPI